MGNSKSSKLNLGSIKYKLKNSPSEVTLNLLDHYNYDKPPQELEIEIQLLEVFEQIEINQIEKESIMKLPMNIKWKLICRHKDFMKRVSKRKSIQEYVFKHEAEVLIDKLKSNNSIAIIQMVRRWIFNATDEELLVFFNSYGVYQLISSLEVAEMCSRNNKNFAKQLELLKIIEFIVKTDDGIYQIVKIPNSISILFLNISEYHIELTSTVFEILCEIFWVSSESTYLLNEAINKHKAEKFYSYRFEPFFRLLESKNIILIENTITFIVSFVNSPIETSERISLKSEFIGAGIIDSFDKIKDRIGKDWYSLEYCTYDYVKNQLQKQKYESNDRQVFVSDLAVRKEDMQSYEQVRDTRATHKRSIDLTALHNFRNEENETNDDFFQNDRESYNGLYRINSSRESYRDSFYRESYKNERESDISESDNPFKDNVNIDFPFLNNGSSTTNLNKLFYLENYDTDVFEKQKEGILTQIDVFEKMLIEDEEEDETDLRIAQKIKNIDKMNIEQLFKILKDRSLKNDMFQEFLTAMQKMASFEESDIGKQRWKILIQALTHLLDLNSDELVSENKVTELIFEKKQKKDLIQHIRLLEENIMERDKEIKELIEERNKLREAQDYNNSQKLLDQCEQFTKEIIIDQEKIKEFELEIENLRKQLMSPPPMTQITTQNNIAIPNITISQPTAIANTNGNIPPAPNLLGNIPKAPNLLGGNVPPAPNLLGNVPKAPNLLGNGNAPPAPNLLGNAPKAPNLLGSNAPKPPNLLGKPAPPNLLLKTGISNIIQQQEVVPIKKKKEPSVPLKNFMWNIVKYQSIKDTIWEKVDDTNTKIDVSLIETLFKTKKKEEEEKKPQIIEKITVLEDKKARAVELVLCKMKISNPTIVESLFDLNEKVITSNNIESLLNICPTSKDYEDIKKYKGDIKLLGTAEKYFIEVEIVPELRSRLEALKFFNVHNDLIADFQLKSEKLTNLFINLRSEKKLFRVLEYILAIGNHLNGTSDRGGAFGFKLDALDKSYDFKTNDNKKTLLMIIIESFENKDKQDFVSETEDLELYELGVKVPMSQLNIDLNDIKKYHNHVKKAISSQTTRYNDKIKNKFEDFEKEIAKIIEQLAEKLKKCDEEFNKSCVFYCENPKDGSDKFCEKFFKFWTNCKKAKMEITKEKDKIERAEKLKKKLEENKKKAEEIKNRENREKIIREKTTKDRSPTKKNVHYDELIQSNLESLKGGSSFVIVNELKMRRLTKKINKSSFGKKSIIEDQLEENSEKKSKFGKNFCNQFKRN